MSVRPPLPALAALACLCASGGCQTSSVFSHTETSFKIPPLPPNTQGLSLAAPTVGLFIGVSEYGARAGVGSTPAHTLSASLMYEPFFQAATLTDADRQKEELGIPSDNYFPVHANGVCALVFGSNGLVFASASDNGSIAIGLTAYPRPVRTLSEPVDSEKPQPCGLASTAAGWLASIGAGGATIWPSSDVGPPFLLPHPKPVTTVAFSRDGSRLLTTSEDGVTRVFPGIASGREQRVEFPAVNGCDGPSAAEFSPDGLSVALVSCGDVWLAPVDNPAGARRLGRHTSVVGSLAFSPDGSRVATAGGDGTRIWAVDERTAPVLLPIHSRANHGPEGAHLRRLGSRACGVVRLIRRARRHEFFSTSSQTKGACSYTTSCGGHRPHIESRPLERFAGSTVTDN